MFRSPTTDAPQMTLMIIFGIFFERSGLSGGGCGVGLGDGICEFSGLDGCCCDVDVGGGVVVGGGALPYRSMATKLAMRALSI